MVSVAESAMSQCISSEMTMMPRSAQKCARRRSVSSSHYSGRVVRIAEYEQTRVVGHFGEVVEVHRVAAVVVTDERVHHYLAPVACGSEAEGE